MNLIKITRTLVDKNKHYSTLLFWLILVALLLLTLTPSPPKPISINQIDKLYHFCAFFGFSFAFCLAYRQINNFKLLVLSCLLGILIEVLQYYIPNRGFSFADMLADFIGCFCGLWFARKTIQVCK